MQIGALEVAHIQPTYSHPTPDPPPTLSSDVSILNAFTVLHSSSIVVVNILISIHFVQNFEPFLDRNASKLHLLAYKSYAFLKLLYHYCFVVPLFHIQCSSNTDCIM